MSIVEHLEELRKRILLALVAIGIATTLGYIWYGTAVGPIPSLGEILRGPYCALPPEQRFGGTTGECRLLATSPFEMFLLRIKVGFLAGIVFSSPFWLGQIWAFITPGLKKNERRWTLGVSISASILFLIGAVLAYFVLAIGLSFLLTLGDEAQIAALNGEKYFNFAISLLLIFGVSFEVPLLTVLLNAAGIISYQQLKEKRRFIIAFLFVFAAFITPGQDPFSMVILAVALCLMMEIATQITRINDKRRATTRHEWLDTADGESSRIDPAAPLNTPGTEETSSSAVSASAAETLGTPSNLSAAAHIDQSGGVTSSSIPMPESITEYNGKPIVATPAPRSTSGARPIQEYPSGRREGLNLQAAFAPANTSSSGVQTTGTGGGATTPDTPASTPPSTHYFDDVL